VIRTIVIHGDGHRVASDGIDNALEPPPGATVWVDLLATSEVGLAAIPA
jgi:hypothetical protein